MKDYKLLVQIHEIIRNAYPEEEKRRLREVLKKTERLIREEVELKNIVNSLLIYEINKDIANLVKADRISERVKIVTYTEASSTT